MARNGRLDLFGPFVEVPPDERKRFAAIGDSLGLRELFDALALPVDNVAGRRRCATLPCSAALHAAAAVALIAVPLLMSSELPGAPGAVQAFFVTPMVAPPAPPPPPPAPVARAVAARTTPASTPDSADRFIAPIEVPSELRPEEGLDLGIEGGVPGGVAGGVPGGVVGGIVGGLPEAAASPPPSLAPVRVGGHIKEPVRIWHVDPVYPKVAMAAAVQGVVIIEAVIDARGHVAETRILRGVPILDEAALEAVRQWVFTPTLLDGVPMPVVMTVTVTFRLKRAPRG